MQQIGTVRYLKLEGMCLELCSSCDHLEFSELDSAMNAVQ